MADPIETISTELEIFGLAQPAGSPPMTETYLHVRRRQDGAAERAVMGLPAYKGEQGDPGAPGAVHQGERTTAQLEALRDVLTVANVNWAYRNTDTDDQWVWTGETFVIYHEVYATPGPVGPPPVLEPGALTVGGEEQPATFGVRVNGANGTYTLGLDLPTPPAGEQGPTGPSGSVIHSVDVADDSSPAAGDVLAYSSDGKLRWVTGSAFVEEYVVSPSGFPTATRLPTDTRAVLFSVQIPARPYPYRFDFAGGVDVYAGIGTQVDVEIRRDNQTSGEVVGLGKGQDGENWREVMFRAHSNVDIDPTSTAGIIPINTPVTLYVAAVKRAGVLLPWQYRSTNAQLRVRLMRVGVSA
jgi:hypothetical protein